MSVELDEESKEAIAKVAPDQFSLAIGRGGQNVKLASRIIGKGDVISLVEKAQLQVDENDAEDLEKKLLTNKFDFEDFLKQIKITDNGYAVIAPIDGYIEKINFALGDKTVYGQELFTIINDKIFRKPIYIPSIYYSWIHLINLVFWHNCMFYAFHDT